MSNPKYSAILSTFADTLLREVRSIRSHPRYLILMTVGILFSYVFFITLTSEGQPQNLPIGVVDHDGSYLSRRLCHELDATQGVSVQSVYCSHAEARRAMQRQEIYAFVEIPKGTYSRMLDFQQPHIAFYSNNAYLLAGSLSNKTLVTIGKLASGAVHREILKKKGFSEQDAMGIIQPIEFDTHCIGNPMTSYQPYLLTTLLPGIIALIVLLMTIFVVAREQKAGTVQQWFSAARGNLLCALSGKLFPYLVWFSLLGIIGNIIFYGPLQLSCYGSPWLVAAAMVMLILAAQCMGVFITALISDTHMGICIGAIYGALSFTMSGFSFPVENMPLPLQSVSLLFPLRHHYLIYSKVAIYGGGFADCWSQFCALLCFVLAGLVGALIMARQQSRSLASAIGNNTQH